MLFSIESFPLANSIVFLELSVFIFSPYNNSSFSDNINYNIKNPYLLIYRLIWIFFMFYIYIYDTEMMQN